MCQMLRMFTFNQSGCLQPVQQKYCLQFWSAENVLVEPKTIMLHNTFKVKIAARKSAVSPT